MWLTLEDPVRLGKMRPNELRSSKRLATHHIGAWRDWTLSLQSHELLAPMHGGEPLRDDASLRDFNGGIGCHVAMAMEEALLLPKDMFDLRSMRKNEVFLNCKRYLGMVKC